MNDIPTFGFANDTGEPLIFDIALDAWRDAAGAVTRASECRGVTHAELAADVQDSRTDTETEHAAPDTDPNYRYCGCGRQVWGLKEGGRCHECHDRDTPRDTITRADLHYELEAAEKRAAESGRDEALAVVVKALRTFNTNSREYVEECEIGDIADQIERERGDNR